MKKRYTLYNICKASALLFALLIGSVAEAWGQTITPTYPDNNEDSPKMGSSTQVIYANSGNVTIKFQDSGVASCIDGYIRWYVEDSNGNETTNGITTSTGTGYRTFSNGYVWVNPNGSTVAPDNMCSITYRYEGSSSVTVVCEGSSIYNTLSSSGNWTSPLVTIQRRYEIHPASERGQDLASRRTSLNNEIGSSWWSTNFTNLINSTNRSNYFIEDYEVHVPLERKVTFRLGEQLSNYYVPSGNSYTSATQVRWSIYNEQGVQANNNYATSTSYTWTTTLSSSTAVWSNAGLVNNSSSTQVFYMVAEVSAGDTRYPAAFIKLYVEPNSQPLTESQLTGNYEFRSATYLESQGYVNIATLDFDDENDPQTPTVTNNYRAEPLDNANSYYAYAYPGYFNYRKNNRLSVGRQEYGLYRTLNMSGISDGNVRVNGTGIYNDYFANNGSNSYNVTVVDKSYSNEQGGYFLYVDAADEPGVITNIKMDDRLCNDTRLIVTAWICDVSWSNNESERVYADVGLTFKGIKDETETVLNRYYSGEVGHSESNGYANWQQIYFTFNYSGSEEDYDYFVLEVSNNSSSSTGADYAIDDIRVWRSTPNIEVIREDACDASTLTISSDYETLLNNMDWTAGENISDIQEVYDNPGLIKFRFGLQGDAEGADYPQKEEDKGNAYFSFLEGLYENANGNLVIGSKTDVTGQKDDEKLGDNEYRWICINKDLQVSDPEQSRYSLRVVVSTDIDEIPTSYDDAQTQERIYNFRALKDYNYAVDNWETMWSGTTPTPDKPSWLTTTIDTQGLTESNLDSNLETYASLMQELYGRMEIPRIRIPWTEDRSTLYLSRVDVASTDLHYVGEILGYDDSGNSITADGYYQVILFDALQVENGVAEEAGFLNNDCNLISDFYVRRPVRITVKASPDVEGMICAGTQRQVTAQLINVETDEALDESYYGFDWFLGTMTEYDQLTADGTFGSDVSLKEAIEAYRSGQNDYDTITEDELNNWNPTNTQIKTGLLSVFSRLRTDVNEFVIILETDTIIAMPFIKQQFDDESLYCTEITPVPFDAMSEDVPEVYPGIPGVEYPEDLTDVPVRLGLRHLTNNFSLTIPLQEEIEFAVDGTSNHYLIANPNNKNVSLYNDEMPVVATLDELSVQNGSSSNCLKLTFNERATTEITEEGREYILLIPFVESADGKTALGSTCDGLVQMHIKIVPEYLTWQDGRGTWYNEGSATTDAAWKQSTEAELFMGDGDTDANGSDNIDNIYSPLYFTKITIPDGVELELENPTTDDTGTSTLIISDNIKYDMAVDTVAAGSIEVKPYYINKVSEIYFKPNATLYRQDYLTYDMARVEFEMTKSTPYWMSSPLKGVYAGDMYAPSGNGKQETPAFDHITYNETDYNRWNPAFYQKAWNKAVSYSTKEYGTTSDSVDVVQSNWSIEYNDVWVPYSVGKGFYARVEEQDVKVRLPKADTEYTYVTKALYDAPEDRTDNGQLADDEVTITLDTDVDGDGKHYLVGNPYMAYLNMSAFFAKNTNLVQGKFWILDRESSSVVAGTPDVDWDDSKTAYGTTGYVAPMTAFFVELSSSAGENKTITFTTDMMATKSTAESNENLYTRSYVATNPQLTITAKSAAGTSRAAVIQRSDASNQYDAEEDAVVLLDSELDAPTVYTVAGNYASAVNVIHDYSNVPLGVYADDNEDVELTIEGISQLTSSLYLYDAVTRSSTELTSDSYTLNLTGSSHGRYSLTTEESISVESDIRIYSPYAGQIIVVSTASDNLEQVLVYDLSGKMVAHRQNIGSTTCTISVPGNIYLIRAISGQGEAQAKLKVK